MFLVARDAYGKEAPWTPDFLIIGAQKAGTTALYDFIKQHPKVVKKKLEVHFFDINFFLGVDWYQAQFAERPTPDHIIGDKSPYYMFHPYVPERVHSLYPKVKIIAILRNPVDRAYSQYWMNVRSANETLSFEKALKAEHKRLKGENDNIKDPTYPCRNHRRFSYLSRGIYVEQLRNWLTYFPREQLWVISSDDLRNDANTVLNQIFEFLGLPPHQISILHPDKHSQYEPMDPNLRKSLVEYYRPYNEELEKFLNMKFNWN